jgi:hypothetical protein
MASLALFGASATLLALLFLALRPITDQDTAPEVLGDVVVIRVLTRCHWCEARDLVRVPTTQLCADCARYVCDRHASPCALCARTTCCACGDTWSGLDGVACRECQGGVS